MEKAEKHDFVHSLLFPSLPAPQKGIEFLRFYMPWDTWLMIFTISQDFHQNYKFLTFCTFYENITEFIKIKWFHVFCGIPRPHASESLIFLRDYRCLCEWRISAKTGNILQNSKFRENEKELLEFHFSEKSLFYVNPPGDTRHPSKYIEKHW